MINIFGSALTNRRNDVGNHYQYASFHFSMMYNVTSGSCVKWLSNIRFILLVNLIILSQDLSAQYCDPSTPTFYADLTGQPNGVWVSPYRSRSGHCCGVTGVDRCVEFILTLDSAAVAIRFDITAGAVPPGALYYQIDCGPMVPVGSPICLNGTGPHHLTFCKPGNNPNEYSITSISQPTIQHTQWASPACRAQIITTGLIESEITWSAIPSNATYNAYLSCATGCDTIYVSPGNDPNPPAYVDYRLCGTPSNGCATSPFCDTVRIYFSPKLNVTINPDDPVLCYGQSSTTVNANISGGRPPYSINWSNGQTGTSIQAGLGTYTVTVTDSNGCDIASDMITVTRFTTPITANAGADRSLCTDNQTTSYLQGAITAAMGAMWIGAGTIGPSNTSLSISYTPTPFELANGQATLQLITTGNSGCPGDTDEVVLYYHQSPALFVSGSNAQCVFSNSNYSVTSQANTQYHWTATGGIVTGSGNSVSVEWTSPGNQTLTLYAVNSLTSCDSTVVIPVTVHPLPQPVINGDADPCVNSTNVYSVQTEQNVNYQWTVEGGTIVQNNGNSISVNWNSTGQQQISVLATSIHGCSQTALLRCFVQPLPNPFIIGDTAFCSTEPGTFQYQQIPGSSYSWSTTGGNLSLNGDGQNAQVNWYGPGTYSVTLTETSSYGCTASMSISLTILPQPAPRIMGPAMICQGQSSTYTTPAIAGDSYYWQVSGGTVTGTTNSNSITVNWNTPGNAMLTLHQISSNGCDSTVSLPVTIHPLPAPLVLGNIQPCIYNEELLYTAQQAGVTYQWSVVGGTVTQNNGSSVVVNWQNPGFGQATVTATTQNGCSVQHTLNTTIQPRPVPVISGNRTMCSREDGVFSTAAHPNSQYQWTVWGGSIVGPQNGSSIIVRWNASGQAMVTLTETNDSGCDSTVSITVSIEPEPVPVIQGSPVICMQNINTYSVTPVPGHTYLWQVAGGNIINNSQNSITVYWPSPGNGSVSVMEHSPEGCDSTVSFNVLIAELPEAYVAPVTGCEPLHVAFSNNTSASGTHSYRWNFGDGSTSNSANPLHSYNNQGNYTVQLIMTNSHGCSDTSIAAVNVYSTPNANFSVSTNGADYYVGMSQLLLSNLSEGASQYEWHFGDGNTSSEIEPVHEYTMAGHYDILLIAMNDQGCPDTISRSIDVKLAQTIYVPNAFTPNNDGINDQFKALKTNITRLHIDIFDRWGEIIYTSDDVDFEWDATCKGRQVQADVYVYRIEGEGTEKPFVLIGSVTVVR